MNTYEEFAQNLMEVADTLGGITDKVNQQARLLKVIQEEPEAYKTIVKQGVEVVRAMRELAMSMDREAYSKYISRITAIQ